MKSRAVFADRVVPGPRAPRGRRTPIAPQLRGRVRPGLIAHWRRSGWRVHWIGQAAYAHSPDGRHHLLVGVWPRRAVAPAWSHRLGRESAGYLRRIRRLELEQTGRRYLRDERGRFVAPLPWWRTPGPRLYRWLEPAPSLFELERGYR